MLVENWNIFRNQTLLLSERESAFIKVFSQVLPALNIHAAELLGRKSLLDAEDFSQGVAEIIWKRGIRQDLEPLPELHNSGEVYKYFKTSLSRHIYYLNPRLSRTDPMGIGDDLRQVDFEYYTEELSMALQTNIDFSGFDLNMILERYAKSNPFCAQLLLRWHVTHQGISYNELCDLIPEYRVISPDALKERNAKCKRDIIRFFNTNLN
jgi:hypothetical protein